MTGFAPNDAMAVIGEFFFASEEAYRGAYRLIVDHRDLLDEIAERLLANEVIERDEIREIMDSGPTQADASANGAEAEPRAGDRAAVLVTKPPEPEPR